MPCAGAQASLHPGTLGAGDETALYVGEASGQGQWDATNNGCAAHFHFTWSAGKLEKPASGASGFALIGDGALIGGDTAYASGESGNGSYAQDPCGDVPGCSVAMRQDQAHGPGFAEFGHNGDSVGVTVYSFGWTDGGACGLSDLPVTSGGEIGTGTFPASEVGSPTITVALSYTATDPGVGETFSGSGTLTLHRVDTPVSAYEHVIGPATLLQTVNLGAGTTWPGSTVQSYEWQMRRSNTHTWTTLATTSLPAYSFKAEVAGDFKLQTILHGVRPTPVSVPRDVVAPQIGLDVMFPTREQIGANQAVRSFANHAWRETLRRATPLASHEVGFWIQLDTCKRKYDRTYLIIGPPARDERAEINLGRRPPDDPKVPPGPRGCAIYTVATFHTHTTTEFRRPLTSTRKVGPSGDDQKNAEHRALPGLVFDYIEHPSGSGKIPFGWGMDKPARLYYYGPSRRPTPK